MGKIDEFSTIESTAYVFHIIQGYQLSRDAWMARIRSKSNYAEVQNDLNMSSSAILML